MALHARQIGSNLAYWAGHRKRFIDAVGPDVVKYVDDFVQSPLAAADAPLGWTVTLVEAGAGESTITKPDEIGGALLLTTDAAENDGINMQLAGESFELTADQRAVYFGVRFKMNEATQSDILAGLCITDTTLLGGMTDGVYMEKLDGVTSISAVTEKDSTETQSDSLGTFAANTYTIWEFFYTAGAVYFFIDGALVATHTANIPDDEALTPSIHFLTGEAAAKTCTIDWIRAIQIGR